MDCTIFLQWALPRLHMRWKGFRKVRKQVCKRLQRRLKQLKINNLKDYKAYLTRHDAEWAVLDEMCRITISRFYRDRSVYQALGEWIMPELAGTAAKEYRPLRCWSAGCASGEEPYTLSILWHLLLHKKFPTVDFQIIGTDAGAHLLERAKKGCYPPGSMKDLPEGWIDQAFTRSEAQYCLRAPFRHCVTWQLADIRQEMLAGPFDLILCRNLVAMYFDLSLQVRIFKDLHALLKPGAMLVLGSHESLPKELQEFEVVEEKLRIYRKRSLPDQTIHII